MGKHYLVTSIYAGALHISPMRLFDNEADAWAYYNSGLTDTGRMYLVSPDQEPKLMKKPK